MYLTIIIFAGHSYSGELSIVTQIGLGSKDTTGIKNAGKVIASVNGRDIYVGSNRHGRVSHFSRDSNSGLLTFLSSTDSIPYITDMLLSPDERYLYLATLDHNTLECYSRDVSTGSLKFSNRIEINPNQNWFDYPYHLCLNRSGKTLYVVSEDAVSVFSRDFSTGILTFRQMLLDERGGITELGGASSIDISPDQRTAYVASHNDSCISWYQVDSSIGMLSYAGKVRTHGNDYYVLKYPSLVSVSDNGKYVIAASIFKCALAWFSRNPINGELTFGGELIDSGPTVFGIYEISEFKVFAGGTRIFTAAGVSSGLFSVDTNSGKLTWLESVVIPTFPNQFHSGTSVAICGDNIYTTGYDGTLTILKWTPNTTNLKSFSTHKNVNPGLRTGCLSDLLGRKAKQQITHSRSDLVMASHGSLYSRWITKRK